MDRNVSAAQRQHDDQEAAAEGACAAAAAKAGVDAASAEMCDDGACCCPECPWKSTAKNWRKLPRSVVFDTFMRSERTARALGERTEELARALFALGSEGGPPCGRIEFRLEPYEAERPGCGLAEEPLARFLARHLKRMERRAQGLPT